MMIKLLLLVCLIKVSFFIFTILVLIVIFIMEISSTMLHKAKRDDVLVWVGQKTLGVASTFLSKGD